MTERKRLKCPKFVRANRDYYAYMMKQFPTESVWKKALEDTEKLLDVEL